jgi:hypothetical protein
VSDESIGTGDMPDEQDRQLLADVGGMLERTDPPPGWMVELARLSFELRGIDAELAELVADSRVDAPAVAVRSAALASEPRMLTFESDDLLVEIEVEDDGRGGSMLTGQLVPAQPAQVELRQPNQPHRTVEADELGRFAIQAVLAAPFSLVCHRPNGRPVASAWIAPA